MEPVKLYERVESLYQWAWRFQLLHGAQLLPWERSWLAQILHKLTDDLTKLAAMLDMESPRARPPCLPDSAEALSDLAEHALWLAEQATKLAQHTLHHAELTLQLARPASRR